ncbi:MAG TPA: peptidoglycan-associated lipoprotein Pal [Methylomirabilota bacterium]|nr:peptidoglycan-associated lipoprotein Pal [Methylomirabilota bacterium]
MRTTARSAKVILLMLALAGLLTGCPKRPVATGVAAPAPPAPTATPAPTPAPPAMVTPAPAPAPAPPPRAAQFVENDNLKDVYFDFDKSDIRPPDAKILDANAAWLKTRGNDLVLIEGHCDERGTNEYNLALGERRARATMNYLLAQGLPASRITIISYGKERPVCSEHAESCWARNRRAHFLVKSQ